MEYSNMDKSQRHCHDWKKVRNIYRMVIMKIKNIPTVWSILWLVCTVFLFTCRLPYLPKWHRDNPSIEKSRTNKRWHPRDHHHHHRQSWIPAAHHSFWSLHVGCLSPSHSNHMPLSPRSLKLRSSSRRWRLNWNTVDRPSHAAELSRQMPNLERHGTQSRADISRDLSWEGFCARHCAHCRESDRLHRYPWERKWRRKKEAGRNEAGRKRQKGRNTRIAKRKNKR